MLSVHFEDGFSLQAQTFEENPDGTVLLRGRVNDQVVGLDMSDVQQDSLTSVTDFLDAIVNDRSNASLVEYISDDELDGLIERTGCFVKASSLALCFPAKGPVEYLIVADVSTDEEFYWSHEEWGEDPTEVFGAIIGALCRR